LLAWMRVGIDGILENKNIIHFIGNTLLAVKSEIGVRRLLFNSYSLHLSTSLAN